MHYFPIIIEVVGALVVVDTVVVDVVVVVEVEVRAVVVVVVVERFETQNPPVQTLPGQHSPLLWYTMFLLYTKLPVAAVPIVHKLPFAAVHVLPRIYN